MLVASNGPILRRSQSPHWTEDRTNSRPNSRPPHPPAGHRACSWTPRGLWCHFTYSSISIGIAIRGRAETCFETSLRRSEAGISSFVAPAPLELQAACSMPPVPRERPPMQHNRPSAGPAHPTACSPSRSEQRFLIDQDQHRRLLRFRYHILKSQLFTRRLRFHRAVQIGLQQGERPTLKTAAFLSLFRCFDFLQDFLAALLRSQGRLRAELTFGPAAIHRKIFVS